MGMYNCNLNENKNFIYSSSEPDDNVLTNKKVGFFIRQERRKKRLTGKELANKLNISQQQVSRYERGEANISVVALDKVLKALKLTWIEFFNKLD